MATRLINLTKAHLFYLSRLGMVQFMLGAVALTCIVILFFVQMDPVTERFDILFLSDMASQMVMSTMVSFLIPVYALVYLLVLTKSIEYLYYKQIARSYLAAGFNRYEQYLSMSFSLIILAIIFSLLFALSVLKLNSDFQFFRFLLFLLLVHVILLTQVQLLRGVGFASNVILVLYFLFFLIFPAFFLDFLKVLIYMEDGFIGKNLFIGFEWLTTMQGKVFNDLGATFSGVATGAGGLWEYLSYILGLNALSCLLFSRKQFG
jgi:hypothetical protein